MPAMRVLQCGAFTVLSAVIASLTEETVYVFRRVHQKAVEHLTSRIACTPQQPVEAMALPSRRPLSLDKRS